jgi:hypothetical protein
MGSLCIDKNVVFICAGVSDEVCVKYGNAVCRIGGNF